MYEKKGRDEAIAAAKQRMLAAGMQPKQIAEFLDIPESEVKQDSEKVKKES